MDQDLVLELYKKEFENESSLDTMFNRLKTMRGDAHFPQYCVFFCGELLDTYCGDSDMHPEEEKDFQTPVRKLYHDVFLMMDEADTPDYLYYAAVDAFFDGDKKRTKQHLTAWAPCLNEDAEYWFVITFFSVFKNAYPGFYEMLADILEQNGSNQDAVALCRMAQQYYQCDTAEEITKMLLPFAAQHPDLILPKELLACAYYYALKRWRNALAWLEQVEQKTALLYNSTVYFMMGWCYGEIRDFKNAVLYFEKAARENPNNLNAVNNAGYYCRRDRQYEKSKQFFEQAIHDGKCNKLIANNYTETLLAMGLYADARAFIETSAFPIQKRLRDKASKTDGKNHLPKTPTAHEENDTGSESGISSDSVQAPADCFKKTEQFSSEKLLEDELTAKIEAGQPIFGLQLRLWRRKGEYGRQYVLPTGKIIDLLCEDENGDIYIIELKKDGGYNDCYRQITEDYIAWFEQKYKNKKVYGILCLNDPKPSLVEKVHRDPRLRLFEYRITYTEK